MVWICIVCSIIASVDPLSSASDARSIVMSFPYHRNERHAEPRPQPYVPVPERLLRAFAHDPLAVGVYLAVARCALSTRGPIPLSPADMSDWFTGTRTRNGAILRRIRTLVATGWLIAEHGQAIKLRLLPAWAPDQPWNPDAPQVGKPTGVRVRRVPLDLLDSYVGRIDPQPGRRAALITRYIDRPLLDLTDLGTYALAALTTITPTPRLMLLGLCDTAGAPLPPQPLMMLLMEVAAGRVRDDAGPVALSTQGRFRCGLLPETPPIVRVEAEPALQESGVGEKEEAGEASESVEEVDAHGAAEVTKISPADSSEGELHARNKTRNGSRIGSPNGVPNGSRIGSRRGTPDQRHFGRLQRAEREVGNEISRATWDGWDERMEGSDPPPTPSSTDSPVGGGGTADARLEIFQAIGIRHHTGLADVPLELLRAWQEALDDHNFAARFRDPAGFAYAQLRAHLPPPSAAERRRWNNASEDRHFAPIPQTRLAPVEDVVTLLDPPTRALVDAGMAAGMDAVSALVHAERELDRQQQAASEEVYRALRARALR
jgi:hypothetical protein